MMTIKCKNQILTFSFLLTALSTIMAQADVKYISLSGITPMLSAKYYCQNVIDNRVDKTFIGSKYNEFLGKKIMFKLKFGFDQQVSQTFKAVLPFRKKRKPLTIIVHSIKINPNNTHQRSNGLCSMEIEFISNENNETISFGIYQRTEYHNSNDLNLDAYGSSLTTCFQNICRSFNQSNWKTNTTYPVDNTVNINELKLNRNTPVGCYLSFGQLKRGQGFSNTKVNMKRHKPTIENTSYWIFGVTKNEDKYVNYISDGTNLYIKDNDGLTRGSYLKILEFGAYLYYQTIGRLSNNAFIIDSISGEISKVDELLIYNLDTSSKKDIFKRYKASKMQLSDKRIAISKINNSSAN